MNDNIGEVSPHPLARKVIAVQNLERIIKIDPTQKWLAR